MSCYTLQSNTVGGLYVICCCWARFPASTQEEVREAATAFTMGANLAAANVPPPLPTAASFQGWEQHGLSKRTGGEENCLNAGGV